MFTCVCVCVCMHSKRLKRLPRLCEDGGPVEEQEDTHTQTMNRRRTHTHTKGRRRTHTTTHTNDIDARPGQSSHLSSPSKHACTPRAITQPLRVRAAVLPSRRIVCACVCVCTHLAVMRPFGGRDDSQGRRRRRTRKRTRKREVQEENFPWCCLDSSESAAYKEPCSVQFTAFYFKTPVYGTPPTPPPLH